MSNLLGRLDGIARTLPDPTILIRSFVRREAQLSSYIENTFARFDEIAIAEGVETSSQVGGQVLETLNAERAILAGVEAVFKRGQPITNTLIRQMHSVLLTGVRGHEGRGRFREVQVYIGNHNLGIEGARFVPAPPHLLPELMDDFETYMTGTDNLPPLLQIGLLHYQFEAIHPFEDGNGRLGRTLMLLGLCRHQLLSVPLLNASLHLERNRQAYYDALMHVSTHGDWTGWLSFFLASLRVSVVESMRKLTELLALQREYHNAIRSARNYSVLLTLVDNLFISPVVTIPQAAKLMGLSWPAANTGVQKLVTAGASAPARAGRPRSTSRTRYSRRSTPSRAGGEPRLQSRLRAHCERYNRGMSSDVRLQYHSQPLRWFQRPRAQRWIWRVMALALTPVIAFVAVACARWGREAWTAHRNRAAVAVCEAYVSREGQVVFEMRARRITTLVNARPWGTWWTPSADYPTVFLHGLRDAAPAPSRPATELVAVEVEPHAAYAFLRRKAGDPGLLCFAPRQVWKTGATPEVSTVAGSTHLIVVSGLEDDTIRVYAGRADAADASSFSFDVEYNGRRQRVEGHLRGNVVVLEPQAGETFPGAGWTP